jgi:hypothetical protein
MHNALVFVNAANQITIIAPEKSEIQKVIIR